MKKHSNKNELSIGLTILVFSMLLFSNCSKSSSTGSGNTTPPPPPPPECTTDACVLVNNNWVMIGQTIETDLGTYTFLPSQYKEEKWSSFILYADSTYLNYSGQKDRYSYDTVTRKLTVIDHSMLMQFLATIVTSGSASNMTLREDTVWMHPMKDSSAVTLNVISSIAGEMHDSLGVDTSQIHFFVTQSNYVDKLPY